MYEKRSKNGRFAKSKAIIEIKINGVKTKAKKCRDCKMIKPLEEFKFKQGGVGDRYFLCKPCEKEYNRQLKLGISRRPKKPSKEQLYQWYIVEGKSQMEIAKLFGYKTCNPIYKLMKKYKIPAREQHIPWQTRNINGEEVNVKKCFSCKRWVPVSEYAKDMHRTDGKHPYCRDCVIQKHQEKRARMKKGIYTLSVSKWREGQKYFKNRCAYCGSSTILTQDHFIPFSKGGEYTSKNIIPACQKCNLSKRDKSFFDWYPAQSFYSKTRERKILRYLGYKDRKQQISLF